MKRQSSIISALRHCSLIPLHMNLTHPISLPFSFCRGLNHSYSRPDLHGEIYANPGRIWCLPIVRHCTPQSYFCWVVNDSGVRSTVHTAYKLPYLIGAPSAHPEVIRPGPIPCPNSSRLLLNFESTGDTGSKRSRDINYISVDSVALLCTENKVPYRDISGHCFIHPRLGVLGPTWKRWTLHCIAGVGRAIAFRSISSTISSKGNDFFHSVDKCRQLALGEIVTFSYSACRSW